MPRNAEPTSKYKKLIDYLTQASHVSAPFITTFLLIHLTAPALASVGGSSLSSQTMLLGREYYQTNFGEKYLVLGPLTVHSLAGLAKRVISPAKSPRPLSSLLSTTGYAIMLIFLPIHYLTHRVNPTVNIPPIFSVGPSELDYEFVKVGLELWPWRSWFLYTGLVVAAGLHAADGVTIIWRTLIKDHAPKPPSRRYLSMFAIGAIATPVFGGIYALSREKPMVFSSILKRYKASFVRSLVYRV